METINFYGMDPNDPWKDISVSARDIQSDSNVHGFEDDFKPLIRDTLPDSQEYLAILENKLNKLKSDSNLLGQLAQKREDCMNQLLNNFSSCEAPDDTLETPIENSTILRTFAPEKQALTKGELVKLVKYEHLVDENDTESCNNEETNP